MRKHGRLDFAKLRHVPIEQVAELLGIKLKKSGNQLRGTCPICQHDSQRAFTVTVSLGRWWCFGHCRAGGDALELVAQVRQTSKVEAAAFLAGHFKERA